MEWRDEGIILGTRRHGETSVILEVMTRSHGRHLGMVRGGRSRKQQPVLQAGNRVDLVWRARLDEHLGTFQAEALELNAARLFDSAASVHGLQLLAAHVRLLPERDPHERLYDTLGFDPIEDEAAPPGGESMAEFKARVAAAFALALQQRGRLAGALAVVTHGLVVRAVIDHHLALAPGQVAPFRMRNASLTICAATAPHGVELMDCTRHLDAGTAHAAQSLSGG